MIQDKAGVAFVATAFVLMMLIIVFGSFVIPHLA